MFKIRKSEDRGLTRLSWLDSRHSFSFGEYYDQKNMGFGSLRVINEDWVAPGQGFGMHGHKNMEIVTYVLSGTLTHRDSLGNGSDIRPGDVQVMSAGRGIQHSEFNPSEDETVHLLQIWMMPDVANAPAGYQQRTLPARAGGPWRVLASPDGAEDSLTLRNRARLLAGAFAAGERKDCTLDPGRTYWLQVARGHLHAADQDLRAGDGLAVEGEGGIMSVTAPAAAEALLFDMPP